LSIDIPLGEHPDITIARAVSEIDELRAELRAVTAERDQLLHKIDAACNARDTANAKTFGQMA
jgi:uncharacterized protein YpiB (UPF0302 family)